MKRTLNCQNVSHIHSNVIPFYMDEEKIIYKKHSQQKKKTSATSQSNSKNIYQDQRDRATCNILSLLFAKQSDETLSKMSDRKYVNSFFHRLKYKSLDKSSSDDCRSIQKNQESKKTNSYVQKKYLNVNEKYSSLNKNQQFIDPQKNETYVAKLNADDFQMDQNLKLKKYYQEETFKEKTTIQDLKFPQKLFSSYNVIQQKNKLYKQITQSRNRKYSCENQNQIKKLNNYQSTFYQKELSTKQNKNSIYSTLHSNSQESNQTMAKQPIYADSFRNKVSRQVIRFYPNMLSTYNFLQNQSQKCEKSIIHELDDCIEDKKVYKVQRNKEFIRKSKKQIEVEVLPETDTCIHNKKQQKNIFLEYENQNQKFLSKNSIQHTKRRGRFTSLNQCGYTIVSKYNKSQDKKSIMQESNIVFQASKHVNQPQYLNEVSSNFEEKIQPQIDNKIIYRSYIQNEIDSNLNICQIKNFVRQKTRNNFIRQKKQPFNTRQQFQLLNRYIKDQEFSIRFDLNLQYQNQ